MKTLITAAAVTVAGLAAPADPSTTPVSNDVAPSARATISNNTFELMARLVGGEWLHEIQPDENNVFRVRNVARFGPGARSIIIDGWLGTGAGMFYHANTQVRLDDDTGGLRFSSVDQDGLLSDGTIILADMLDAIRWDWTVHTPQGEEHYEILMQFTDEDAYTMHMYTPGSEKPMQSARFERSYDTPQRFLQLMGEDNEMATASTTDDHLTAQTVLPASPDDVWHLWTTNEGLRACLVESSDVQLRIGGPYEWYFSMDAPEGSRGSEQCTILSYRPNEMLSFTWNAPPQFEHARFRHTWVVVTLEPVDQGHTRVTITHHGWAERIAEFPEHADEWKKVRAYFESAWPYVLGAMKTHLEGS